MNLSFHAGLPTRAGTPIPDGGGTPMMREQWHRRDTQLRVPRGSGGLLRWAPLFLLLLVAAGASGQDLENFGTITNHGLMRVKDKAQGLPDTIGGGFDYKGSDQRVPARTYRNLFLTGSGTKTTFGGSFLVRSDVTINPGIVLDVDSGAVLDLGGSMHGNGYLLGKIRKSMYLSGPAGLVDFGGIGAELFWSGTSPDSTTVLRSSGVSIVSNGKQSIARYFDITPKVNNDLSGTLVFHYENIELNGQDPLKLTLWSSNDGGLTWTPRGGQIDTGRHTITKANISSFGMWTASDSLHPLGPFRPPTILLLARGDGQVAPIGTLLKPFGLRYVTADTLPLVGERITYSIITTPSGAGGQALSNFSAITDTNGYAETNLLLGNRVGTYVVEAKVSGSDVAPLRFAARATSGNAGSITVASATSLSGQVARPLAQSFVAVVRDSGGNTIPGIAVEFSVTKEPGGGTLGPVLSAYTAISDSEGRVSTRLTLGSKAGLYQVSATIGKLRPAVFSATGTPAPASLLAYVDGDNQTGKIFATLAKPFQTVVTDSFGNGVPNQQVTFAIANAPAGASGQRVIPAGVRTDTNGVASATLRLGNKLGDYLVTATVAVPGNPVVEFHATGLVGAPAFITLAAGQSQTQDILNPLDEPFTFAITDSAGNPVPGDSVVFAIESAPSDASDQLLSATSATTDSAGRAITTLTLGSRPGVYKVKAVSRSLPNRPVVAIGNAVITYADANNDRTVNIADLTTMIDATMGRLPLTKGNFTRADIDSNKVVDITDEQLLVDGLLDGRYDTLGVPAAKTLMRPVNAITDASLASAEVEFTNHGVRFNMNNSIGLRGIELVLRFKNPVDLGKTEVFRRTGGMHIPVKAGANGLVRLVAYSDVNAPIAPGSGSIFRLPLIMTDTTDIEIIGVIASDSLNRAIIVPATRSLAPDGKYPSEFVLLQNYPNPFNLETKIEYTVPDATAKFVTTLVQVFDISGRKIRTLVKGEQEPGHYTVTWDSKNDDGAVVASGVYFIRLWTPGQMLTKKMLLTK